MQRDYQAHQPFVPDFLRAYADLSAFPMADDSFNPPDLWTAQIQEEKLGEIHLPTGEIIACDPAKACFPKDCYSFRDRVEPGRYAVYLGVPDPHTARRYAKNVYAVLHLSEATPVQWEMALALEQKITDLERYHYYGFGVDSGLGCLIDASFLPLLEQYGERKQGVLGWDEITQLSDNPEASAAVFMAGMGDGGYPAFWGFDENHQPCRLLIDFQILRTPEEMRLRMEYEEEYGE